MTSLQPVDVGEEEAEALGLAPAGDWKGFLVESHPGLLLATGLFTPAGQAAWLSKAIRDFPQAPNVTNLDKFLPLEHRGTEFLGLGSEMSFL